MIDPATGEIVDRRRCSAVKADGTACQAPPVMGTDLCMYHSPLFAAEGERGRSMAGRKPTLKRLPELPGDLKTPEDVLKAVNVLVNAIGERDLTPTNVSALVRLYGLALDTMTGAMAEQRLSELEALAAKGDDA
jgi:hypothetical protein